ncbi:MAG: S-layer homology domain-containing protein [Oscillospiraceae bacterium]|nr:S-layer homology domain-containing protein [Oscillospiraceae bacterium]
MIKKLISAVLSASIVLACAAVPASAATFTDVTGPLADAAEVLSVVGILDGMGDGTYRPYDYVTREQFAKIAVCILGQQDKAAASLSSTAFTDVDPHSWARGYISYVAENGIIAGYPDGSFAAASYITYAQTVTVLMRCMGYTDEIIGFHWPTDYINKAEALGLNKGVSLSAGDLVTRGDLAVIVNNALFTEMNGQENRLVTCTGVTVYDDALLYGLNRSDASLAETSEGSFKIPRGAVGVSDNFGKTGRMLVNKDKELIMFQSDGSDGDEIVISSALNNIERRTVDVSYSGGSVSLPYSGTVFSDGEKSTAGALVSEMTSGSRMRLFYDENGAFKSAVLNSYTMQGPVTIISGSAQVYDLFNIPSSPTVIRGGVTAELSDIAVYDVVYYDENTNTVYAYSDKVSGIYEKAEPIKSNVTDVTISGKTFKIASTAAMNKLNESAGAFALGDYVTLLLDRNGAIADVVDTSASVSRRLGVLLSSYKRVDENGNQAYAVKMFLPDGSTMEYTADQSYEKFKGRLMEMSFSSGAVSLTAVRYNPQAGTINKEIMSFNNNWLSSDCSVLVLLNNPEDDEAVVRKIRFSDIEGTNLSKDQVIHVEFSGAMNDVSLIYLQNVIKSDYEYGVIAETDTELVRDQNGNLTRRRTTGSYVVLVHGVETSVFADRRVFSTPVIGINSLGTAVDGNGSVIGPGYVDAVKMGTGVRITAVSGDRVRIDNTVYKAAEGFDIYRLIAPGEYSLISPDEAMKLGNSIVDVYGDDTLTRGGKIRVIIIR